MSIFNRIYRANIVTSGPRSTSKACFNRISRANFVICGTRTTQSQRIACFNPPHQYRDKSVLARNGTYAKVRASLATALLRGKSIRRLYESQWFVACLLAVCLLLKRFFSSLARFAGSSATHTLRKNICWVFFVASDPRRAGVTRRRRPLVDCATPPRHLLKKQKSKSLGLNNVPA